MLMINSKIAEELVSETKQSAQVPPTRDRAEEHLSTGLSVAIVAQDCGHGVDGSSSLASGATVLENLQDLESRPDGGETLVPLPVLLCG